MKRTRWTRIALALQFDDYSDNLLESSLARTIYDYGYVYAMAMSIANGYGYAYGYVYALIPMRLFLCAYAMAMS